MVSPHWWPLWYHQYTRWSASLHQSAGCQWRVNDVSSPRPFSLGLCDGMVFYFQERWGRLKEASTSCNRLQCLDGMPPTCQPHPTPRSTSAAHPISLKKMQCWHCLNRKGIRVLTAWDMSVSHYDKMDRICSPSSCKWCNRGWKGVEEEDRRWRKEWARSSVSERFSGETLQPLTEIEPHGFKR